MTHFRKMLLLSLLLLIFILSPVWAQTPSSKYRPAPLPPLSYSVQLGQSLQMDVIADIKTGEKGLNLYSVEQPRMGVAVIEDNLLYYIPTLGANGEDTFSLQIKRRSGYTFAVELVVTVLPPPPPDLTVHVHAQVPVDAPLQLTLHAGTATVATAEIAGPLAFASLQLPYTVDDSALIWASATGTDAHGQSVKLLGLGHSAGAMRAGSVLPGHIALNVLSTATFALMQREGFSVEQSAEQTLQQANRLDPERALHAAAMIDVVHRNGCCLPYSIDSAYAALLDPASHAEMESMIPAHHIEGARHLVLAHNALPLEVMVEGRLPLRRAASGDAVRTDGLFGLELSRQAPWGPEQLQLPWRRGQLGVSAVSSGTNGPRAYTLNHPVEYFDRIPLTCPEPHPDIETPFDMYGLRGWELTRVLDVLLVQVEIDAWPRDLSQSLPPGCTFDIDQMLSRQRHYLIGRLLSAESRGLGGHQPAFLHIELPQPGVGGEPLQAARIDLQSGCSLQAQGFDTQCYLQHQWNTQGEWQGLQLWASETVEPWQTWVFNIDRLRHVGEPFEMPFGAEPMVGEWQVQSLVNWSESSVHTSLGVHGWWLPPVSLSAGWLESSDSSARAGLRSAPDWRSFLLANSQWQGAVDQQFDVPGERLQPAPWRNLPIYSEWQDDTLRMESHYDSVTGVWSAQCPQPIEPSCRLHRLRDWVLLGSPFSLGDGSPDAQARMLVRERVSSRDAEGEWQTGDWRLKIYNNHGHVLPVN